MKVSEAQKLRTILLLIGIIMMLCRNIYAPLFIVGAVITFSGLIVHFRYNKCPHCGRQLGRNYGEYCQYCGYALD